MVGFDDIPLAEYFDPPLTTIRIPSYGLGWAASESLIKLIQDKKLDQPETFLESELIIRQSSSPRGSA
jgi:DNA-binding LacI/PurR family transcriptional regulator